MITQIIGQLAIAVDLAAVAPGLPDQCGLSRIAPPPQAQGFLKPCVEAAEMDPQHPAHCPDVEPTAAGRRFEGHAHDLLGLIGQARRDMQVGRGRRVKQLHLSCQYSLVRSFLLGWIDSLRTEAKDLKLHVEINFSAQIQRDILAGATDIGSCSPPKLLRDLEVMELGAAEFVMVWTETVHLDRVDSATYVKAAYTTYLARLHDQLLPDLANPQLVIGSEDLGVEHLACHGGAFYPPRFAVALAQTRVGRLAIV